MIKLLQSLLNLASSERVHASMTALERKKNSEDLLSREFIPVDLDLPAFYEEQELTLRSAQEVAKRILVLAYLNCLTQAPESQAEIVAFLQEENLWEVASEEEKRLFKESEWTEDEITMVLWHSEAMELLLWALSKIETLPWPTQEQDIGHTISLLPPFLSPVSSFVESVFLRPLSEIADQADLLFRMRWAMMKAEEQGKEPLPLHPAIAYERQHAMDWLLCLREQWDEDR